jgi:hypothetical protein
VRLKRDAQPISPILITARKPEALGFAKIKNAGGAEEKSRHRQS